jgi:predicted membrane-bound spermidine synthase
MGENWQYGMKVEFQVTKVIADEPMSRCHMKYVETPCHGKVLMMDGEVQFSTADEERYGKMMMCSVPELPYSYNQPPYPAPCNHTVDILVLGGGDGLLARDLLKRCTHPQITIVDWDAKFVKWASDHIPENKGSLKDPRVRVLDMDVRDPRVIEEGKTYDCVILDLPDPDSREMRELYTYVAEKILPAVAKTHVIIKAHVGPAVSTNKKHPNWTFIETFQLDMEDAFYKTGRRTEYTLDSEYIPSYMHEWGFVTCVAWKHPDAETCCSCARNYAQCYCLKFNDASAGAYRQPSPSCCSDDGESDDLPSPAVPPAQRP